jgi:DNA topoisomerase-2
VLVLSFFFFLSLDKADDVDDSDDEFNLKPTKKTKTQLYDFFDKVPVANKKAPTRTASSSKKPAQKAKVADSEEEEASFVPVRTTHKRAARGITKKYIELDSDEDGGGGDGSVFEDD